jgi:hypothetical protein
MCRRRSKRSAAHTWRRRLLHTARIAWTCGRAAAIHAGRRLAQRRTLRPPRVVVVGAHPAGRRLVRTVAHTARAYAHALGAALPPHTTIVLVPVVVDADHVDGLLQVVAPSAGPECAVLYLATGTRDGSADDGDLLAVLRLLVTRLLEPATGGPAVSVPVTLTQPTTTRDANPHARVVPLRPRGGAYRNGVVPPGAPGPGDHPDRLAWPDDDPA